MLKNSEYFPTVTENKGLFAVLFLSPPAGTGGFVAGYWRKIAGVPFLLRNILNIQRGGVKRLALVTGRNQEGADQLRQWLNEDPRVTMQLDWLTDSGPLAEIASGKGDLLLLDGSILYDKNKIRSAVQSESEPGNTEKNLCFFLGKGSMASFFKQMDGFNFSRLEQARERSLASESEISGRQRLVYFPENEGFKISSEQDFKSAGENIIKKSGGLTHDSFVTRVLSRPVSKRLTRLLINTRITPNQITVFSFILGLGSALCFFKGGYGLGVGGAGLLLLSIWVDGVDGEIARIKFMESPFGARLDILCDNVVHVAVFFSIGMGLYNANGETIYLLLGALSAGGSLLAFVLMSEGIIAGKSTTGSGHKIDSKKKSLVDKMANRDFTHFLFVLALLDQLPVFIWLTAVGVNVMALYLLLLGLFRKKSA